MSMFEIFAIIQDWYSGNQELAAACLAANSRMTIHEAHAYLDQYAEEGMTVLFSRIVEEGETEEYQAILDNMVELRDYLNEVIKDLQELIDEKKFVEIVNS